MTASLAERLQQQDRIISAEGERAYQQLLSRAGAGDESADDDARAILELANKTLEEFQRDEEPALKRAAQGAEVESATKLVGEVEKLSKRIVDAKSELEKATGPLNEKIQSLEGQRRTIERRLSAADKLRRELIEDARRRWPWLGDATNEAYRELGELSREYESRLAPVMGEAVYKDDRWVALADERGNVSVERQQQFDDFSARRAAHEAYRESLEPRIAAVRRRIGAITKLALQAWPTLDQLEAISAESD